MGVTIFNTKHVNHPHPQLFEWSNDSQRGWSRSRTFSVSYAAGTTSPQEPRGSTTQVRNPNPTIPVSTHLAITNKQWNRILLVSTIRLGEDFFVFDLLSLSYVMCAPNVVRVQ